LPGDDAKDIAMIDDTLPAISAAADAPPPLVNDGQRRPRPILRLSANYRRPSPARAPLFRS
jgi:hypothetical protein